MIDKIYEYGLKYKEKYGDTSLSSIKIESYICLDEEGNFQSIEVLEKKNLEEIKIPKIPNTGGTLPNILIEKILVIVNEPENESRDKKYLDFARKCEEITNVLHPVVVFLENVRQDSEKKLQFLNYCTENKLDISKDNDKKTNKPETGKMKKLIGNCSFKINGIKIQEIEDVVFAMKQVLSNYLSGDNSSSDKKMVISAISGNIVPMFSGEKKVNIVGERPLIPMSEELSSYFSTVGTGKNAEITIPIGDEEGKLIATILTDFCKKGGNHYNNFFHLLHWFDGEIQENEESEDAFVFFDPSFISDKESDKIDAERENLIRDKQYQELTKSIETIDTSQIGEISNDMHHIVFCYPPEKGRWCMYGYKQQSTKQLKNNVDKFKKDSEILIQKKDENGKSVGNNLVGIKNLYTFLYGFIPNKTNDKSDWLKNTFSKDIDRLVMSVYDNTQIPIVFYQKAISIASHFISIDKQKNEMDDKRYFYPNYLNALKAITLYKNRKDNKNMKEISNAYVCGQIYAIYEKIQTEATRGTSVIDMFDKAMHYPSRILTQIVPLSFHHLNKEETQKRKTYYQKMLSELYSKLNEIPKECCLDEQADFILGYYNQNNILYTKKTEGENENE